MTDFELTVLGLIRFAILAAGITYYVTQSAICAPFRLAIGRALPHGFVFRAIILYFMYCPACVGTWVGFFLYLLGAWPLEPVFSAPIEAAIAACVINRLMPSDNVIDAELSGGDQHGEKEEG